MAETKTKPTGASVDDYIASMPKEERRADCQALVKLMSKLSGESAHMWGPSIVGFGSYHYEYDSGHAGEAPRIGFSSRAAEIVLYISPDMEERAPLLAQLGKHRSGKSCVYLKRLADADPKVLEKLIKASLKHCKARYG